MSKQEQKPTILFAADHAGFDLKKALIPFVEQLGYAVEDHGPAILQPEDDYPEIILPVALAVSEKPEKYRAIIIGGSGQGEAIIANRFPEVRAVVYYGGPLDIIKLSREHNDANILSLGARFVSDDEAKKAVELWLSTDFSDEDRHARRIAMIENIM